MLIYAHLFCAAENIWNRALKYYRDVYFATSVLVSQLKGDGIKAEDTERNFL
jgi:hypothetical protein